MKKTNLKKMLSLAVLPVLTATMVLFANGCKGNTTPAPETDASTVQSGAVQTFGTGNTVFSFSVTDLDGKTVRYEIHTDEKTVGSALEKVGLISGADGLYDTVDGKTLDYSKDHAYWAFYENGKYAMTGADVTAVKSGTVYEFKAEKA